MYMFGSVSILPLILNVTIIILHFFDIEFLFCFILSMYYSLAKETEYKNHC